MYGEDMNTTKQAKPAGWTTTLTGRKVPMCDGSAAHCDAIHAAHGNHFCPVTDTTGPAVILDFIREQVGA